MDIDPEKNPFGTGTDNPGYDETGEMSEMTDRFPPFHPDVVQKI